MENSKALDRAVESLITALALSSGALFASGMYVWGTVCAVLVLGAWVAYHLFP